jgi:hypothetical protein
MNRSDFLKRASSSGTGIAHLGKARKEHFSVYLVGLKQGYPTLNILNR